MTRRAARRYLNYRLSQNGNWGQPNAQPGGKRASFSETLKSLQEGLHHPGPGFLLVWGGGGARVVTAV